MGNKHFCSIRGVIFTGARKRDLASSVLCTFGGPYCICIISISCRTSLKSVSGIRARWSSKVLTSENSCQGSRPTKLAISSYLMLEKLTSKPCSGEETDPFSFRLLKMKDQPVKISCKWLRWKSYFSIMWRRATSADSWSAIEEDSCFLRESCECSTCLSSLHFLFVSITSMW